MIFAKVSFFCCSFATPRWLQIFSVGMEDEWYAKNALLICYWVWASRVVCVLGMSCRLCESLRHQDGMYMRKVDPLSSKVWPAGVGSCGVLIFLCPLPLLSMSAQMLDSPSMYSRTNL